MGKYIPLRKNTRYAYSIRDFYFDFNKLIHSSNNIHERCRAGHLPHRLHESRFNESVKIQRAEFLLRPHSNDIFNEQKLPVQIIVHIQLCSSGISTAANVPGDLPSRRFLPHVGTRRRSLSATKPLNFVATSISPSQLLTGTSN